MERKLAAVLFVDLVNSTALVSASDPEIVRRRVTQFFDHVSRCIEAGGMVEKFAGDAVMAAFGIPQAHEDDAERAVRAALAILESVADLELEARIGIESGEVVTGDSTFATGEAVNLAARLQQVAEPGQILVGPAAHGLTLGRVEVDEIGPVDLRGREEAVWAWAAISATDARRPGSRSRRSSDAITSSSCSNTFARAVRDRNAHLFTVYGEPGVGKTRLTNEFIASREERPSSRAAACRTARASPTGRLPKWSRALPTSPTTTLSTSRSTSYASVAWPKRSQTCSASRRRPRGCPASGASGRSPGPRGVGAADGAQPLILIFEDIHWAEEPRADRAHDFLGGRRLAPDYLPRPAGAPRRALRLGRRPPACNLHRARAARRERERAADRRARSGR